MSDTQHTLLTALSGGGALPEALRSEALARFKEKGLPTPRLESWKFTNLRALDKLALAPAREVAVETGKLPSLLQEGEPRLRLVFVNGVFNAALSGSELPEGVTFARLAEGAPDWAAERLGGIAESDEQSPLLDLNTALAGDGPLLQIARNREVATPIELLFLDAGGDGESPAAQWRGLIRMEENSRATIIEHHVSQGSAASFVNGALEVDLAQGANLRHIRSQQRNVSAVHLVNTQVEIARDARYEALLLVLGGAVAREDWRVRLSGSGAHCGLNASYMLEGAQHSDITTSIEHAAPHTTCDEAIKGALGGRSRGVFQGLIRVNKDSQHIEGNQSHRALLLSDDAEVDAKPELEIYADDVKCSHGATVGDLDREALFYLRSRGIPAPQARRLLIISFLSDVIENFGADSLTPALLKALDDKLNAVTGDEA